MAKPPEQPPLNNDIIIHSNNARTTRGVFQGLIDAISQIQQFAVIERTGQEIPEDFLTIRGKLNFFNVGFGNGFFEGLIFAFLSAIVIPIMSDDKLRAIVTQYFRLAESDIFLRMLNCLPIIVMGGMCCYLSKYRIGIITRKAVDSLLVGRLCSLFIKGGIIFCVLCFLGNRIDPVSAWQVSNWITLKKYEYAREVYRVIMNSQPHLVNTAWEILTIFFIATITPFVTVWLVTFVRAIRNRAADAFWTR